MKRRSEKATRSGSESALFKRVGPGGLIIFMTLIWIMPLYLLDLANYPHAEYINSFYTFYLVFLSTLVVGLSVNIIEGKWSLWERSGYWGRFWIFTLAYIGNFFICLFLLDSLYPYFHFAHFGSCPGGSFLMLYWPTAALYLVWGIVKGLILTAARKVRTRNA